MSSRPRTPRVNYRKFTCRASHAFIQTFEQPKADSHVRSSLPQSVVSICLPLYMAARGTSEKPPPSACCTSTEVDGICIPGGVWSSIIFP